ncbi:MAG TPA: DUF5335 family protein [Solirubrobacteraceae bacterium]
MSQQMAQPAHHEWQEVLDAITARHAGQPVTVQVLSAEQGSQLLADHDALAHIIYRESDDVLVVCFNSAHDNDVRREHIVKRPFSIIFDGPADALERIDIEGADGARTLITLHHQHADAPGTP